jgi:predicted adenine nucleotide alpha hydrolase (AANH) superfamily ATPase
MRELEHGSEAVIAEKTDLIIHWLDITWQMITTTLSQWTVKDLSRTYHQEYCGKIYSITYQWTLWRILTQDMYHGASRHSC